MIMAENKQLWLYLVQLMPVSLLVKMVYSDGNPGYLHH